MVESAHPGDGDVHLSQLYDELHRIAEREFRGQGGAHTLQPTALVNEAWLKLQGREGFESRSHALGFAAKAMRHLLVDHARRKRAAKRGGDMEQVTLVSGDGATAEGDLDVVDLDAVLTRLAQAAPRQAQVVELKFFGGLSIPEIAEALGVSHMTVSSDWRKARVWLAGELAD